MTVEEVTPAAGSGIDEDYSLADHYSLADLSTAQLQEGFRRQVFTPVDVLDSVTERVTVDERLNAYHEVFIETARREAEASRLRWVDGSPSGPLDGVPVTIKENMHRKGVTVPSGTALANPPVAQTNCPIVDRLEASGAVIVGTTVMPDLGMLSSGVSSRYGVSRNAWNPAWTTGGSSAGAAIAAAAGHGPVHLGTDIGGSVRFPATWSGLAGLKPSHSLIPLDVPYYGRVAGPLARRAADLYPAMDVVARFDTRDTTAWPYPEVTWTAGAFDPAGMRIGLQLDGGPGMETDPEVRAAVAAAAKRFAAAGAEIVEVSPIATDELLTKLDSFWRVRAWSTFRALSTEDQTRMLPYIAEWAKGGEHVDGATTVENHGAMMTLGARARTMTADLDLLLSPVAPVLAFDAELPMPGNDPTAPMAQISFTVPFNMSGQPSGSINAGRSADGRWIGLQITGQMGYDKRILDAMTWWESVREPLATPPWEQFSR